MIKNGVNNYLDGIADNHDRLKREGFIIRAILGMGRLVFNLLPLIKIGLIVYGVRALFS